MKVLKKKTNFNWRETIRMLVQCSFLIFCWQDPFFMQVLPDVYFKKKVCPWIILFLKQEFLLFTIFWTDMTVENILYGGTVVIQSW